jgi:phospholipid transport system substrate-binding protein
MMYARTRLTAVVLAGALLLASLAGAAGAADEADNNPTRGQSTQTPVAKFVQDIGDRAISICADKSLAHDQRSEKFRQILRDSFDLSTIGRFVIGRSWNNASADQQQEYMQLFEALVIKNYGNQLELYAGEGFQVTGSRSESEKDFVVTSDIVHPDGSEPTEVDWRVRQKNGKFGVIDVVVEGISLSVTHRQEYAAIIQRDGGKLDGLLDLMRHQLEAPEPPQHG